MAKHHADLIFCRKQPGIAIGRLCEKCVGGCMHVGVVGLGWMHVIVMPCCIMVPRHANH